MMKRDKHTNLPILVSVGVVLSVMGTLVVYSPTLYRMFCNATGYAGTVRRTAAPETTDQADATGDVPLTVYFDANVGPGLQWEFRPEQRKVETHFGEPTKAYYYAKNNSDKTIIARATYNVTPYKAAPYFFKIQCFCFTDEKLGPGESARMPLELFVDKELLNDHNVQEVRAITLSYTFYEQDDLTDEEIAAARDLSAGSEATEARLDASETVAYDNDAPRQ